MKGIIITTDNYFPKEVIISKEIIKKGFFLNIRKINTFNIESFIRQFSVKERSRIIVHSKLDLAIKWNLSGIHFKK